MIPPLQGSVHLASKDGLLPGLAYRGPLALCEGGDEAQNSPWEI